jgi:hypothetical protein
MTVKAFSELRRLNIPVALATIAAATLLPPLVHLIPAVDNVPMGARLLPIFYAPLLAILLGQPAAGLLAALVAPLLNYLFTGMPTREVMVIVTVELVAFSLFVMAARARWPKFVGTAPIAYLLAKVVALVFLVLLPVRLIPAPPLQYTLNSLTLALPGIIVLLVLNILAVRR